MVDFAQARKTMVDNQLRTGSVTDRRVLAAMGNVPREHFVPEDRRELAYIDDAQVFETEGRRALSAPVPFARLIQLAEIEPGDRVLDVGALAGYSTAIIARLATEVVGLEPDAALVERANQTLAALGIENARVVEGDATSVPRKKFDVVVVEGAVEAPPESLLAALEDGGRLVAVITDGASSVARIFVRSGRAVTARTEFDARMPALSAQPPEEHFVF